MNLRRSIKHKGLMTRASRRSLKRNDIVGVLLVGHRQEDVHDGNIILMMSAMNRVARSHIDDGIDAVRRSSCATHSTGCNGETAEQFAVAQ